ncbi:MAG: hypothetical protein ABI876_06370 [Bacteroidota bacterium]
MDMMMAAFRGVSSNAGLLSDDELIHGTARRLGYVRLGGTIRTRLKSHLRVAIQRYILARDGGKLYCPTPTLANYTDEMLLKTLIGGMRKGYEYQMDDLTDMVTEHLGYSYSSGVDEVIIRMKKIVRLGRKSGLMEENGGWIWKIA